MSDDPDRPFGPGEEAQSLSDRDQTTADADQSITDLDQSAADADQSASERDQLASDRDQAASDRDQSLSDLQPDHEGEYARSRRDRSRSSLERDLTSQARSESSRIRDEAAMLRDRQAEERDAAARARDELAGRLDAEMERLDLDDRNENGGRLLGAELLIRAASHRKRAAAARARSAVQREAAAEDRHRAAEDRRQAAADRERAAEELAAEGFDHLTGALRRRVGMSAIQREMDRTDRTREGLVLAFVDVIGLKAVNDRQGHLAGDEVLRSVAREIQAQLRPYDVLARFGGDEFVCSLTGADAGGAAERFESIAQRLAEQPTPTAISVGLTERLGRETLLDLIRRADADMIERRSQAG